MSEPYIGEIRIFGFNFAPIGWAFCDGQLLPISQNTALFSILGTYYGGNGTSNFALPNFQGSAPLNTGDGPGLTPRTIGEVSGTPTVTLITSEIPSHTHAIQCSNDPADQTSPIGNVPAEGAARRGQNFYAASQGSKPLMNVNTVGASGGSQPHNNMPPYQAVNFCIALQGIYPPRS